jgi:hypothetical protein
MRKEKREKCCPGKVAGFSLVRIETSYTNRKEALFSHSSANTGQLKREIASCAAASLCVVKSVLTKS